VREDLAVILIGSCSLAGSRQSCADCTTVIETGIGTDPEIASQCQRLRSALVREPQQRMTETPAFA
jgi:hypothetical protein